MKHVFTILTIMTAALFAAACNDTSNTNESNTANSNRAVVLNNNGNANTAGVAVTNSNINSNKKIAPTREDYEKNKSQYESEAKSLGSKIGTGLEDGWLFTKTKYELAAADDLRDSTITVDVENSAVTLRGTVASAAQKTKADEVAKAVTGVKSVKNDLKIVANPNANSAANNTAPANANHKK